MRRIDTLHVCAAAAAMALGSAPVSACDGYCGYGYDRPPAYVHYAPPAYAYARRPVYAYAAPVYSYYAPSAYELYERVNSFPGPRWGRGFAAYNSPVLYGGIWRSRAYGYYAPPRVNVRPYRGNVRGPVVRSLRRW